MTTKEKITEKEKKALELIDGICLRFYLPQVVPENRQEVLDAVNLMREKFEGKK